MPTSTAGVIILFILKVVAIATMVAEPPTFAQDATDCEHKVLHNYSLFFCGTITKISSLSFFIRYFSRANFSKLALLVFSSFK